MKARWQKFYEKAEEGLRVQYASRFAPPDGVNPRYKVIDKDIGKIWVVADRRIATGILSETLDRSHQAEFMEVY